MIRTGAVVLLLAACAAVAACGGGAGDGAPAPGPSSYSVGGTISGLTATGLVLTDNGGDRFSAAANATTFAFATPIASGGAYAVAVAAQPLGETCTVASGGGMVSATIITVAVSCVVQSFSLSGTVSGLPSADSMVLINETTTNSVTVPGGGNGTFSFSAPILYGASYAVSVETQPPAQTCTVANGSGTAVTANVTTITVNCAAAMESVLYSFRGGPGDGGRASQLVLGKDGNFYGTNSAGGAAGFNPSGTVFKITPAGVETVLYSFAGLGLDGPPTGGLVQASDGNFYGMTQTGGMVQDHPPGIPGFGAVFKITPEGTESVLYAFQGGADGSNPVGALVQGPDGALYGMTAAGGFANYGTVFKVTLAGVKTTLYLFQGGNDGVSPEGSLVLGTDGNFYGVTAGGVTSACANPYYCGAVFKITPAGVLTVLHDFLAGADGDQPGPQLIQGADGNFYGTTEAGGTANLGTVFRISPDGTESVLHSFQGGADGDGPAGPLLQGSDGNFYGTTWDGGSFNCGAIYQLTPAVVKTTLYSFQGCTVQNPSDGASPGALIEGSDGSFYGTTAAGGANTFGTVFKF